MCIKLYGVGHSVYTVSGVADGNDTLFASDNALSVSGGKLNLSIKDTAGKKAKGSVNLSDIVSAVADGNTNL